ncbi:MAG: O-antigen ligase family protein [Bacteroidales bacterium]|nr:O-antigen ligase family protein [Bacteroidales bacterium]
MKRKKIHFYIQYIVLLFIVFALPFQRTITPPLILLLSFNWVVEVLTDSLLSGVQLFTKTPLTFDSKWKTIKENRLTFPLFLFVGLFAWLSVSLIYSEDLKWGVNDFVLKLPLLAFPLILFSTDLKHWTVKRIKLLFNIFILGCLITIFYNLYHSYANYVEDPNIANFFYMYASFIHHPSYSSMFYVFGLAVMIYFLLNKQTNIVEKIAYFLFIPIFIGEIVVLSSKTAFITLFLLFIMLIFYIVFQKRIKKINLLYFLIVILIGWGLYAFLPKNFNRFSNQLEKSQHIGSIKQDTRYVIWSNACEVAKENLPWGTGAGDVKAALKLNYAKNLHFDYYLRAYNCHNQYLQFLVALGIIGFLLFVGGQLYALFISCKKKYFLFAIFTLVVSINFLTESMLERQAGVVFFALFNTLLCVFAFVEPLKE